MPTLSIFFSSSEISALFIDEDYSTRSFNYPYISSNEGFIRDVCKLAEKDLGVSISNTELLVTGFPKPYGEFLNPKLFISLEKVASREFGFYPVYTSNFTVVSKSGYSSNIDLSNITTDEVNSLSNLVLYRQVIQTDNFDQFNVDNLVRFLPESIVKPISEEPVIMSGDRFSRSFKRDANSLLLILDLIKIPGKYQVILDKNNLLPCLSLAYYYDGRFGNLIKSFKFDDLGTLINSPGGAEIYVSGNDGTSQLLQVESDKIFILPMAAGVVSKATVKRQGASTQEMLLRGGSLGLIVDTRIKNNAKMFTKDYIEDNLKVWHKALEEALCTYH
jgi:hypothetical protein